MAGADGLECGGLICFPLDLPRVEYDALAPLLDAEERRRAARFHAARHGTRFTVAHARLRQILGHVLDADPAELRFGKGVAGKPELAGTAASSGLQFNLSHSGGWGLAGWAQARSIGVDVEVWRETSDEAALVRRYFSAAEISAYEALPAVQQREGFFNAWTRKEAYVKALGRGLTLPLASFDVSLGSGALAQLLRPASVEGDTRVWSLAAPAGVTGTSLAVVLQADVLKISSPVETARASPISG